MLRHLPGELLWKGCVSEELPSPCAESFSLWLLQEMKIMVLKSTQEDFISQCGSFCFLFAYLFVPCNFFFDCFVCLGAIPAWPPAYSKDTWHNSHTSKYLCICLSLLSSLIFSLYIYICVYKYINLLYSHIVKDISTLYPPGQT